ncbi:hypothetical protein DZC75_11380 [Pseudomonas parafulva]|uniref:Lipoprotein n=1 Tax=Pseudomonas parafulva TaxID=157782 RepID=A0AAI8KBG9_9PSED|nr:hypothetical protein [Pseudomonas parafulva]AXO88568.1 hypothetical protein DZC75_11380 [Pseudomonas parafulva]
MRTMLLPLAIVTTALVGCSDPKKASEENFEKAAQAWLDKAYPECLVTSTFPMNTLEFDVYGTNKTLNALAEVGVLTAVETSRKDYPENIFQKARTEIKYRYELTDEGRKYLKDDARTKPDGTVIPGLCIGRAKVDKIEQFSEPGDMMGHRISEVTYTYKVDDLPKWASTPALMDVNSDVKRMVASQEKPIREKRAFVLTNNGWIHERLFRE